MKNRRVLVVELSSHFKCLEQLAFLLCDDFKLKFFVFGDSVRSNREPYWTTMFPSHQRFTVVASRLTWPSIVWIFIAYLRIGVHALSSGAVLISTGPEDGSKANIKVLDWILKLTSRRRIWIVRNPGKYLEIASEELGREKLSALGASAIRSNALLFESNTQMHYFRSAVTGMSPKRFPQMEVVFDRYSDYPLVMNTVDSVTGESTTTGKFTVGILGVLSPERRDFETVYQALELLPHDALENLKLTTLGAVLGEENLVLQRLVEYCEVEYTVGWLSEYEMLQRGIRCDVLLSPMDSTSGYGTAHGTGSFGDAVALRRQLLAPSHTDPLDEFSELLVKYSDAQSLAVLLLRMFDKRPAPIEFGRLQRFTKGAVRPRIAALLSN